MNNNKKILVLIIVVAFLGGVFGSIASSRFAQANLFTNFYDQYLAPLVKPNPAPATTNPSAIYTPTVDYEQAVVKAVEQNSPAVISIIISKNLPVIEQCPYNPFSDLPPEFQQFFGGAGGTQFYQPCQKGTKLQEVGGGSGFIISADGLIITNKHVVSDAAASYTVLTNDGKKYDAQVLAVDPNLDLAVIKIAAAGLPVASLGDSDALKLGQTAIAIGNALGEFRNTVSVGVISGLSRSITATGAGSSETLQNLIQTDAAINAGNSGGPLLNLKGEVIGINVAMASGAQNIGFSLPINQVKKAIQSVKNVGRIITPYLGVRYASATNGVLVQGDKNNPAVIKNSPADKAGIKSGDIITQINGQAITADNSLSLLIQKYNVGDTITLKILRDKKEMEVKVTLEERPSGL